MAEPWVSIDDVAAHLGVRKDSVYRWIESRGLPAQKIGKLWKLKLSEVDAWMVAGGRRRARRGSLAASPPRAARAAPRPLVLVVDDDEALRETLGDFLTDSGYAALLAGDGAEALALLRSPSGPRPELILLDLHMPAMDGWAFREEQARHPQLRVIPTILFTAERRADLMGPDVLRKPVDLAVLGATLRRYLEVSR